MNKLLCCESETTSIHPFLSCPMSIFTSTATAQTDSFHSSVFKKKQNTIQQVRRGPALKFSNKNNITSHPLELEGNKREKIRASFLLLQMLDLAY
jgi:hypothetical protein